MIVSARQKVFALWYFTVVGLLTALTLEQLFRFNLLSPVFWLRLAVYAAALIFSFYVLGEYIHNRELALEELRRIQSTDVVIPTADGRELRLRCVVRPEPAQARLLARPGLDLPERLRVNPALAQTGEM